MEEAGFRGQTDHTEPSHKARRLVSKVKHGFFIPRIARDA
jgi:hypothetical protein